MEDEGKTKEQLIKELTAMRQRVAELDKSENDHKLAEEALRESQELFRLFMDYSPIYVFFKDEQIRSMQLSRNYEKMLGRPLHELIGKTMDDLFPSELAKKMVKDDLRILHEGKPIEVEEEFNGRIYTTTKFPIIRKGKPPRLAGFTMDITEAKLAEKALRESEERYRIIAAHVDDIVWELNMNLEFVYVNPSIERVLGYSVEETLKMRVTEVLDQDGMAKLKQYIQVRLHSEQPAKPNEYKMRHKDGHWLDMEVVSSPVYDSEGRPVGFAGIARDVSERKRTEEEIQRKTVLLAAINNVFERALVCETSGEVARMCLTLAQELTTSQFGFIGEVNEAGNFDTIALSDPGWEKCKMPKTDAVVMINNMEIRGIWGRVIKDRKSLIVNQPSSYPDRVGVPEGHPPITAFLGVPLEHSGSTIGMISLANKESGYSSIDQETVESLSGAFVEALMHKRAEEALRENEDKYRTLVENANEAIVVAQEGMLRFVNPRTSEITAYSREELTSMPFVTLIHPDDRDMVIERHQRRLQGEAFPYGYPFRYVRKDGGVGWVEINAIRITWADRPATLNFLTDITERKRGEEEKASLGEHLRQSQKLEAIGSLAGGIAHDFNNLLTVIKGYSQISLIELNEKDPLAENLREICSAANRASDLTRQLLAFSRKQILEPKVLDPNKVIQGMEKMLRRMIGEDMELLIHSEKDLGRIKADPGQMEQVIFNLAVNARDAMPSGGKLMLETDNVYLDEEYAKNHISVNPGNYVRLCVSDTGCGMEPEVRDRVFEPFFTTKEKGKGTGLGLSTVYGIVKQSGGNIWVYSEMGKGTSFKIYFPRVDEPADNLQEKRYIEAIPRGSETVLVVEDENEVRRLVVQMLRKQGYKVLEAPNSGEALMVCEQHQGPIHLILTDVVMPRMSGPEFIERMRQIRQDFKTLYMSGYTGKAVVYHGVTQGDMEFIQKPFTYEMLSRKVREVLDKVRRDF